MHKLKLDKSNGNIILDGYTYEYKKFSNEKFFFENLVNQFNFFSDYVNNKKRYRIEVEFF